MTHHRKRLILHCGLPKTATTALQHWFHDGRAALAAGGVSYPGPHMPHEPKQQFLMRALQRGGKEIAALKERLDAIPEHTIILSHEGLANHFFDFDPDNLRSFRDAFRDYETTVVFLTRAKQSWLRSYHAQCVLNPRNNASELWGTALSVAELAEHPRVQRMSRFKRLAMHLQQGLGADEMVWLDMRDDDWFDQLRTRLGIADLSNAPLPRTNQRLPDWAVEVLRQVNAMSVNPAQALAWRQAVQGHLKSDSVQLRLAQDAETVSVDPAVVADLRPDASWSDQDRAAFNAFFLTLPQPDVATPVPRILWMLWLQGWDNAPDVVQSARVSWEHRNPGWDIRLLDQDTLSDHLPQDVLDRIFEVEKPPCSYADQIRLELLQRYGGVWTDATTICATPLDDWLPTTARLGFFAFARNDGQRMLANWFLAAAPDNYVIKKWHAAMWTYWTDRTDEHVFFWMHGLFGMLYETNERLRLIWDETPKIQGRHSFQFGPNAPKLFEPPPDDIEKLLAAPPAPVFKMTHKLERTPGPQSLFTYLCAFARRVDG